MGILSGNTYTETYGTTSPASGEAPTNPADGQPMDGLAAVTCVVSAPYGQTLSSGGALLAYLCDATPLSPNGETVAESPSVVRLGYQGRSGSFTAGTTVTGDTSGATGTVFSDEPVSTNGTLSLTQVTGTFEDGEGLTGSGGALALVLGTQTLSVRIAAAALPFEVGQTLKGRTSGATATIATIAADVLAITNLDGDFITGEVLTGIAPPRWTRCPSLDVPVPVGQSPLRDFTLAPVKLVTPRTGRIKFVPQEIAFSGGSTGVTVRQLGQTWAALHNVGR